MENLLFSPYQIKDVTFKNRIMMSPMCMYCVEDETGNVTDFHYIHYASRAVGQVGLIMIEATGVVPNGRITQKDLGIWEDAQVEGLKKLTKLVHENDGKIGIQLAHAGRKSNFGQPVAPSALKFNEDYAIPMEMSESEIKKTVVAFADGARRAKEADFDVIEIHGAHGYLINQFLSLLTNTRSDEYGGNKENRYRFLREILTAVKKEWSGPLFVRISAEEYQEGGNTTKDYIEYVKWMKEQGVDLIDVSSGGLVPFGPDKIYPGYQVPFAAKIKKEAEIPTGAVGLITSGKQAEEILQKQDADLILVGRELLRNPYFAITARQELGLIPQVPEQYVRAYR